MIMLALGIVLAWLWMLATAFHFDDARTEVRHPSRPAHRPAGEQHLRHRRRMPATVAGAMDGGLQPTD